ncbi:nucleoside hydrolase [Leifsonia sp. NPDC058194]|uniref:nucleoside hydrolase n=1 Tax=Leifsonia sp. NPDC058194 TaxID=3346374 RepID=UPI0036D8D91A
MPETRFVHLDCDTGIDDALTIAHLLAHPRVQLVGVSTVSGNTSAAQAAANTLGLFALAGAEAGAEGGIPVAIGEHHPLAGEFHGGAPHVHGGNGVGDVVLPEAAQPVSDLTGPELLIASVREHPGAVDVLAIGPLTNLARALELDPELPALVKSLTIMGGAVWVPGNITPAAEANIHNDAEAAEAVFAADWRITLVPLDVTLQHGFDVEAQRALAGAGTAYHSALAAMLDRYLDFYASVTAVRRAALHDPLASMIVTGDSVPSEVRVTGLDVDTSREATRGRTSPDGARPANIDVVTAVDGDPASVLLAQLLAYRPGA